ncbi:MAG: ATP-binding protein [Defluviitaleaceae bacterium]|nr:ATP-binding protein [Defluviitaleaceae bacterium]MCL2273818.1 ATP-binding protein [Defluviitaleaceae bacterium]
MIVRKSYLSHLLAFKDKKEIKVITGVRRCGKSTLLTALKQRLLESGISEGRIICLNFESARYKALKTRSTLHAYLTDKMGAPGETDKFYLLLDEIQWVTGWEEALTLLRESYAVDIYITSSGTHVPVERSTFLGGAFVHIKMHPLSFKEYLQFNPIDSANFTESRDTLLERKFLDEFLIFGAMPPIAGKNMAADALETTLIDIFDAAMARDVIERNTVRDAALLRSVVEFLAENIGNTFSSKKISDHLSTGEKKTTSETIDNYLTMLEDAFLFHGVKRYDIKNKQHLKTLGKFYMTDMGMRNALLGNTVNPAPAPALKNVIYFELLRRYDRVYLGKQGSYEIDFLADSYTDRKYFQVCPSIPDAAALKQAIKPLESINDNYEKNILTMEKRLPPSVNGIKVINIIDFLLHHR